MITRTRLAGIVLQGVILGLFVFLALMKMISAQDGLRIFRYEAF